MVLGDGLIPQALARRGVAPLPLLGADVLAAEVVAAQGFDPAQPWRPRRMQDLQHQFIGQEGVGARALLADELVLQILCLLYTSPSPRD